MNRNADSIRADIATANEALAKTRAKISEKADEIATLRADLRRQARGHVTSNRLPAAIRTGQERLGVLTSDTDLLADVADELKENIEALQAELAGAMESERLTQAQERAEGLQAAHGELSAALTDLQCLINARIEYEILPLVARLQDHRAESIVRALGCATIVDAWEKHPATLEALLGALHGLPPLAVDTKPLNDATQEAQSTIDASRSWIGNYMPLHIRTHPTPKPAFDMRPSWKPATEEEADKLGLLIRLPGKNVIVSPEGREAYDRLKLAERAAANARQ